MNPLDYALLADENIHPEVVQKLSQIGKNITSVHEAGLAGREDSEIIRYAHEKGLCIITHDRDFGSLAIRSGRDFTGIIHIRPGHHSPSFVIEMLKAIESSESDVEPPFIVVAERRKTEMRIRIRSDVP